LLQRYGAFMSLAGRLSRLVPDLSDTLMRFSIPALISVLIFIYAQLDIADIVSGGDEPGNHVYLGGAAAFVAAGLRIISARAVACQRSPNSPLRRSRPSLPAVWPIGTWTSGPLISFSS
jgi:hypothetical protein